MQTLVDPSIPVSNTVCGKKHYPLSQLPSLTTNQDMKKAFRLLELAANTNITVLITGESGVGKEIFAKTLHTLSDRNRNRFIALNCAAIPGNLLEAELFGSEKGAFTGSTTQRSGKFEQAHQGTLFLDEVGEMEMSFQAKILRVIQEREIYRIGGSQKINLDVRIITATNKNLYDCVAQKTFREDLFYRFNVISIHVPSLRERKEDILALSHFFLKRHNDKNTTKKLSFSKEATQQLQNYTWPGNVRELENTIMRSALLAEFDCIESIHFDSPQNAATNIDTTSDLSTPSPQTMPLGKLKDIERKVILRALEVNEGSRIKTAEMLGVSDRTIRSKLKLYREQGFLEGALFWGN